MFTGANTDQLTDLERELDQLIARYETALDRDNHFAHRLASIWAGPFATTFHHTWTTVDRITLHTAHRGLTDLRDYVTTNRTDQDTTSQATTASIPAGLAFTGVAAGAAQATDDALAKQKKIGSNDYKIMDWEQPKDAHGNEIDRIFAPGSGRYGFGSYVKPADVHQQKFGDCYFMAGLAGVSHTHPDIIKNAVRRNSDGTYTVTIHDRVDGKLTPIEIRINSEMPVFGEPDASGNYSPLSDPAEARADVGDGELWPQLYQKAYAKHLGGGGHLPPGSDRDVYSAGYHKLWGGSGENALEVIAGIESVPESTSDVTAEQLHTWLEAGPVNPTTLSHVYWIDSVNISDDSVLVRNVHDYDKPLRMTIDELKQEFPKVYRFDLAPQHQHRSVMS